MKNTKGKTLSTNKIITYSKTRKMQAQKYQMQGAET